MGQSGAASSLGIIRLHLTCGAAAVSLLAAEQQFLVTI